MVGRQKGETQTRKLNYLSFQNSKNLELSELEINIFLLLNGPVSRAIYSTIAFVWIISCIVIAIAAPIAGVSVPV